MTKLVCPGNSKIGYGNAASRSKCREIALKFSKKVRPFDKSIINHILYIWG